MKTYLKYFSIHLKSQMQHKASFFLTFLGQFLTTFGSVFAIYFLFQRFQQVRGFTLGEALLCHGVIGIGFALSETFARGFDIFPNLLRDGRFDRILVRPQSLILQVLGAEMDFTRLGKLLQALLVLCYALSACGIRWQGKSVLVLILMILSAVTVFTGLFLLYGAVSFFTIEGIEFMNVFIYGGKVFGSYPYGIYGKPILFLLTFLVPLALAQYYPLLYLTGRERHWIYGLSPLFAGFFLIPCISLWRYGVRRYRSTGS